MRYVAVFAHRNYRLTIFGTLGKLETSFIASASPKETLFEIISNLILEELNTITARNVKFIVTSTTKLTRSAVCSVAGRLAGQWLH